MKLLYPPDKRLYPFQKTAIRQMLKFLKSNETHSVYNAAEQGCVFGDAIITVNRAKIARKVTLRELWYKFNGGVSGTSKQWDLRIPTYTRSFNGEHVQLNQIKQVLFKGLKETVCVKLSAFSITVTPDHEVLTSMGWKTAEQLTVDDYVAVDTLTRHQKKKVRSCKPKRRYLARQVGAYHPYARDNILHGEPIKLVDTHRLLIEATENNLGLEEFIQATYHERKAAKLTYNDPKIYHVHHINKNTKDNRLSNLKKLYAKEHQALHCDYTRLGHGLLSYQKVKSVTSAGVRDVYDIVMKNPHRNFVANNIVVHNCGKTIMALVADNTTDSYRTLILCPAIMRLVWEEEVKEWSTKENLLTHVFLSGQSLPTKEELKLCDYIICSYDLARTSKVLDLLKRLHYDTLVLDEAHYLNNTRAKRTKAVFKTLWDRATNHILLSGTPFTTSVVNGYSCFHKILPSAFPDFPTFTSNYCYERVTPWGKEYFGVKNAEILSKIIRKSFYIRYTKQEVLPDLPDKIYQRITLPIQYAVLPKGKNEKEELEAEMEMVRRAIEKGEPPPIPANLAEHRRLQGEAKVPAVCEFIRDQLESEVPVVCFAHHRNVIAKLSEKFKGYNPAVVTGNVSATDRQEAVKRFQKGQTLLFIGNFVAAGTGITLTASSNIVLAELDWSPSVLQQAIDRCHRIGQKDTVNVYWFVVKNSLDETISNVVMNRTRIFKSVLDRSNLC